MKRGGWGWVWVLTVSCEAATWDRRISWVIRARSVSMFSSRDLSILRSSVIREMILVLLRRSLLSLAVFSSVSSIIAGLFMLGRLNLARVFDDVSNLTANVKSNLFCGVKGNSVVALPTSCLLVARLVCLIKGTCRSSLCLNLLS